MTENLDFWIPVSIAILSLLIAMITFFITVYERIKDDRQLYKQVNDYYEAIEYLVFSYYADLWLKKEKEKPTNNEIKLKLKTERVKIRIKSDYSMQFVKYHSDSFFKYLGMVYSDDNKNSIINMNSDFILDTGGQLRYKDLEGDPNNLKGINVVAEVSQMTGEEYGKINAYLETLRIFWKTRYYKWFFRPKLKESIDFPDRFKEMEKFLNI